MITDLRIGHGYDIHRFVDQEQTGAVQMLCGIPVPVPRPLDAHSDGDVVLHAVTDALLGALGQGDLGDHFPDTDSRWSGASGEQLLHHTMRLIPDGGWEVGHVDLTIIAQTPKIAPFKDRMKSRLAEILARPTERVNIKATTMEGLGPVGRCEGIAVHAVLTLVCLIDG